MSNASYSQTLKGGGWKWFATWLTEEAGKVTCYSCFNYTSCSKFTKCCMERNHLSHQLVCATFDQLMLVVLRAELDFMALEI